LATLSPKTVIFNKVGLPDISRLLRTKSTTASLQNSFSTLRLRARNLKQQHSVPYLSYLPFGAVSTITSRSYDGQQRCHSTKIKKPGWANKKPKKTQGQIAIDLAQI